MFDTIANIEAHLAKWSQSIIPLLIFPQLSIYNSVNKEHHEGTLRTSFYRVNKSLKIKVWLTFF